MSICPQCQSDAHLRLQRRDEEPGYLCTECGTWMQFGALPPQGPSRPRRTQDHKNSPGRWPEDFPLDEAGKVAEGLVVLSKSGGSRVAPPVLACAARRSAAPAGSSASPGRPGQTLRPCSAGWHYDAETKTVRITGGGEISARFVSPSAARRRPAPEGGVAHPGLSGQAQGLAHRRLIRATG